MRYPTKMCVNCDLKFRKDFKFCPHCGQQNKEELTVALLFYNTFTNYFSFDARFFKSISPLLFKPGYLPTLFVQGKRSVYLHPGQMYLFVSVLFFFFMTTFVVREKLQWVDMAFKTPAFLIPLTLQRSFYLENNTAQTLSLQIPGVMNPNLPPFTRSGVDLPNGQPIYAKVNGEFLLLLTVTDSLPHGARIDLATLINNAINAQ